MKIRMVLTMQEEDPSVECSEMRARSAHFWAARGASMSPALAETNWGSAARARAIALVVSWFKLVLV